MNGEVDIENPRVDIYVFNLLDKEDRLNLEHNLNEVLNS